MKRLSLTVQRGTSPAAPAVAQAEEWAASQTSPPPISFDVQKICAGAAPFFME